MINKYFNWKQKKMKIENIILELNVPDIQTLKHKERSANQGEKSSTSRSSCDSWVFVVFNADI